MQLSSSNIHLPVSKFNLPSSNPPTIGIIGCGAAGIFAAITCAETNPSVKIIVFEKSSKLLSKVKVSGGGRCNVTHACFDNNLLVKNYPRGERELKSAFSRFEVKDTINWFEKNEVKLKTEDDGRMFPITDNSQTIIDCLLRKANELNITILTNTDANKLIINKKKFTIITSAQEFSFDKIIVASGGNSKYESYKWLEDLGITIVRPVPSLFTFNIPQNPFKGLEGIATTAEIKIDKTSFHEKGIMLVTHWGLSGPAVLKLSAYAARDLFKMNYDFTASINFLPGENENALLEEFMQLKNISPNKKIFTSNIFELPKRLWERLCELDTINHDHSWQTVSKKQLQILTQKLLNTKIQIKGKTTFREEFVTAGGVDLKDIDMKTLESKKIPGLFFCGEIMNVDGITGGFNFQHAWTSGFLAGSNAGKGETSL